MTELRIVLADDHTLFREGTCGLLERDDDLHVIGEAGTGVEALELVGRLLPDVAIVDIEMPDMDGIELTRQITSTYPDVSVLVLTVHDEEEFVLAILQAGAAGYLLKDVKGSQLREAVKALRDGDSILHPSITAKLLDHVRGGNARPAGPASCITDEEAALLRLVARGCDTKEIAKTLGVSTRTVQLRLTHLFEVLGVPTRAAAVVEALRRGLIDLDMSA